MAELASSITAFYSSILLLGIVCLIIDFQSDYKTTKPENRFLLLPWKTEWLEFLLFLIYAFFSIFLVLLFVSSAQNFVGKDNIDATWTTIWSGMAMHLAIILAITISFRSFPNVFEFKFNTDSTLHKVPLRAAGFYFLAAVPLVFLTAIAWNFLLTFLAELGLADMPTQQSIVEMIAQADDPWAIGCMGLMAIVIAPISEELLFRGCIYRFLKGKLRPIVAVSITSFLFGLMHANVAAFIPLFLLGMLLCRCYEKTGKIYICIGFHALFNLNTFIITLIQAWFETPDTPL